jgi:hypothetical protein
VLANIGVGEPLFAEAGDRSVSGYKADIIPQRKQGVVDGVEELVVVSTREVGAADAALKQNVADKRKLRLPMEEGDVAGSVAGAVEHL